METNEVGYYTVPLLPPGQYRVTAEQDGFKSIARDGITIEVDQSAEINFVLEVGAVTEQIEVTADAIQLETSDASRGQVIDNQRIVEMPLNGRNYNQLALLSAGTAQPVGGRFGGFSSGGMRTTQNNFLLDGVDNNGVELAGAQRRSEMVQPSIDAIQEFKVQTNAYAAEYGRAMGSVINVTTKSGTNDIHGAGFYFLRNEALDARNFFTPSTAKKPKFRRNQYGFAVGGPVYFGEKLDWRNKVFWFADAEWTDIRETRTATSTIPTVGMRGGDFSDLLTQRNKAIIDPLTGDPFPGNIIPGGRIDPVANTMINLYPNPQNADVGTNFVNLSPRNEDVRKWDSRADVNVSDADNVFFRVSWHGFTRPAALTLPSPAFSGGNDQAVDGNNFAAGWNHIWSPNLIMSIRGTYNYALFIRDNVADAKALAEELGVFNLNDAYGIPGGQAATLGSMSIMSVSGYANVGQGNFNPVDRNSQNRQLVGDMTWIKGKHTLKFGGGAIRSQNNIFNISRQIGQFNFNARYTKDGQADMLLGWSNQFVWSKPLYTDLRQWLHSVYVQDDWKITPRLTLNLGLRYELLLPWTDKRDRLANFDVTTDPDNPVLVLAGARGTSNFDRSGYKADPDNFMPRVGFAYKLTDKTVLRGGWGMYYAYMEPYGDAQYLVGNPPHSYIVQMNSSATTPAVLLKDGPPPGSLELENATGVQFISYDVDPPGSYAHQWNVNLQREFGRDWLLEVGYSGSKGKHILRRYDTNFSPPGPGGINEKRRYKSAEIT
ncbi:MAG: TonB-dependent receptor, partial [bacterium]|nr:TonB-dependent receptor [bacterium]